MSVVIFCMKSRLNDADRVKCYKQNRVEKGYIKINFYI
jgi:hypothetical protein